MISRSPILVDDRQKTPPSDIRVAEFQALGVPSSVQRLDLGDYWWSANEEVNIVEEKLLNDFINSVADGRLGRFVQGEVGDNVTRSLLLIGAYEYGVEVHHGHWSPESIDNLLADIQAAGVVVLRCITPARAAERLASYWHHTGSAGRTLDRPVRPETNKWYLDPGRREAVRMLMCLPGVGEVRANAMLDEHHSIDGALHCFSDNDKCGADGVGPKMVKDGREFIQRRFK